MADDAKNDSGESTYPTLDRDQFPFPNMPAVYADSISSLSFTGENFKFYLSRNDANMFGKGGIKINPFLQVIIPISGFITFMASAQLTIDDLVSKDFIPKDIAEKLTGAVAEFRSKHPPIKSGD